MTEEKEPTTAAQKEAVASEAAAESDASETKDTVQASDSEEEGGNPLVNAVGAFIKFGNDDGKDGSVKFMSDRYFDDLKEYVGDLATDGEISDDDIDAIVATTKKMQESHGWLTQKQANELVEYAGLRSSESIDKSGKKLPWPLRIFAVLLGVGAFLLFVVLGFIIFALIYAIKNQMGTGGFTAVELTFGILVVVLELCNAVLAVVLCVRLARNKRAGAARASHVGIILGILTIVAVTMADGISTSLIMPTVMTILMIALASYLNPNLFAERKLSNKLQDLNTENRAKKGKLGLDIEGAGYIRLDFFNMFWIFVVGCVLGLIVEELFYTIVTNPGHFQNRAGLLYGPFSPIYGFGALLMTIALNRFKKANILLIFVCCTIIGGAFEYFVSYWMETAFGIIAWDYHDQFLGDIFNGRTCLLFASMFGFLGTVWIKWLLPITLALVNKIPWKARYIVTVICAILMFTDCIMTVEAIDCWYERTAGLPITTDVQQFYATNYPDDWMKNRFQTMNLDPSRAARS